MSNKIGKTGLAFARVWHHVDLAEDTRTLGRLASQIAIALIGKHKPVAHSTQDLGDYVVVSNCKYLRVTGRKMEDKTYWYHTTKPGTGKAVPMEKVVKDYGYGEVLRRAVSRMLPKNKHRDSRLRRLKVFDGSENPYRQNLIAWADQKPLVEQRLKEFNERKRVREEYSKRMANRNTNL
ncbi:54S ribosomal protein L23, mitochondrial [Brettanomyces nanus]|uniref:54S ribosomal protein L23, mitochondrial n=1 Tax=Eeniella nana TaxID=13502 RepID=A0A875S2H4_EENNA|nr:54S ribosomal protein L23, mitochondrial [Brettanomyces nanus]QPG74029.1 54S ribosomal protein L23, mitochondrial [Brettanomyces nanus]